MIGHSIENTPTEYLVYRINIMKKALFIILAVSFATLFFSKGFSLGFFVGGLIAMANFLLLSRYILKMKEMMKDFSLVKARRFIVGKFLIMYLIMAIALFIGARKGMVVFAGTALGLLVVKFTIFLEGLIVKYVKSG